MVGTFLEPSCGRGITPIHSIPYSVAQPLERGFNNYYSIIQGGFSMTEQESYQEHIRYTHDTYCRIVIRHASFDAARMLAARWKREISLEYLTEEKFVQLSTTDEYFQVPDYGETYPFSVRGKTIFLDSYSLAAALVELPEQTQEEIFLYYFQHLTQKEIGEQSGWTRSTIGRHISLWEMAHRLIP